MNQNNLVTIEVEIDDELLMQVRAVLQPLGLTPEDALRMCIEFCGEKFNTHSEKRRSGHRNDPSVDRRR